MQITTVTIYAVQALGELNRGPLSIDDIAKRIDVSFDYAAKVMKALKAARLVKSDRWGVGGYVLTKPLDKAMLPELFQATENGLLDDQEGETKDMRAIRHKLKRLVERGLNVTVKSIL